MNTNPELQKLAASVRGIVFDVDGVLTDGRIIYTDDGKELKQFHVQDGASIKQLIENDIQVGIITGRRSAIVERRAAELGIEYLAQGVKDKAQALDTFIAQGFTEGPLAAVGDDLQDILMFEHPLVAMNITVSNGHPSVQHRAHFVTERSGGTGIVVEIAHLILNAQNKWAF